MNHSDLTDLAATLEAAAPDATASGRMAALLGTLMDAVPGDPATDTDAALLVIDHAVPGWRVLIEGTAREPDGHWHVQLRHADFRDNDEVIGAGRAPTLPRALMAAVLRVYAYRLRS